MVNEFMGKCACAGPEGVAAGAILETFLDNLLVFECPIAVSRQNVLPTFTGDGEQLSLFRVRVIHRFGFRQPVLLTHFYNCFTIQSGRTFFLWILEKRNTQTWDSKICSNAM